MGGETLTVAQSTINSQENKAGVRAAQLVPLLGRYLSVEAVGGSLTVADFQGVAPVKLLLESRQRVSASRVSRQQVDGPAA